MAAILYRRIIDRLLKLRPHWNPGGSELRVEEHICRKAPYISHC